MQGVYQVEMISVLSENWSDSEGTVKTSSISGKQSCALIFVLVQSLPTFCLAFLPIIFTVCSGELQALNPNIIPAQPISNGLEIGSKAAFVFI